MGVVTVANAAISSSVNNVLFQFKSMRGIERLLSSSSLDCNINARCRGAAHVRAHNDPCPADLTLTRSSADSVEANLSCTLSAVSFLCARDSNVTNRRNLPGSKDIIKDLKNAGDVRAPGVKRVIPVWNLCSRSYVLIQLSFVQADKSFITVIEPSEHLIKTTASFSLLSPFGYSFIYYSFQGTPLGCVPFSA